MAYNGFNVLVPDGLDSKSMLKRHVDKIRRRVWLRCVCYALVLIGLAVLVALVGFQPYQTESDPSMLSLPSTMVPSSGHGDASNETAAMYIEDVILMDSEVLVLVRKPPGSAFPCKSTIECQYRDAKRFTSSKATALHLYHHRAAILCPAPPSSLEWDVNSLLISVGQKRQIRPKVTVHRLPLQWFSPGNQVAYEAHPTETDVVVFVHGINHTRGSRLPADEEARLRQLKCVYGGYFETDVTAQAQEVFRCAHPPSDLVHQFSGRTISVKFEGRIVPSVAYYNPGLNPNPPQYPPARTTTPDHSSEHSVALAMNLTTQFSSADGDSPKHHVCSCTMIYNSAKFLKEWVYYNSHLGVSKFFLYDNNSDDDLDAVISSLGSSGFNIQKQAWPWVKTQEAGFSHCSVFAESECKWMLFTDVDEFFYPNAQFRQKSPSASLMPESDDGAAESEPEGDADVPAGSIPPPAGTISVPAVSPATILSGFIAAATAGRDRVGQVGTFCYNFGPSGFRVSPSQGVTQGYTCRLRKTERHKSIVLLDAVERSLENVIHHFTLKRGYIQKLVRPDTAVVNHYKFQAWAEFKHKFHRRAATYVADWTEDRNRGSKDRVPDLGIKAIKPADWESRYCEVRDYGLKNYTLGVFGTYDRDQKLHLPWE